MTGGLLRPPTLAYLSAMGGVHPRPPIVARAPLPAWPSPVNYPTTLPGPLGPPDRRTWRMNFYGATIDGLPTISGLDPRSDPRVCLGPFLYKWSDPWIDRILYTHAAAGYTHFLLWYADARTDGLSDAAFVDLCRYVSSWGFYVCVAPFSKYYDPADAPWQIHARRVGPMIDQAVTAGALDNLIVGMEIDSLYNGRPDLLQGLIDWCGASVSGLDIGVYVHFLPEHTWWGADGGNRFDFWRRQQGLLDGLCYQTIGSWDPALMQGHIADTRLQFATPGLVARGGHPFDMVVMENKASTIFAGQCDELIGDLYGYLSLCGGDGLPTKGFGNGGRMPNGSMIL